MAVSQKSKAFINVRTFRTAVVTAEGSKTFLKKMLPAAVSYILHQRINFDKEDFVSHTHNGTMYTTFKAKLNSSTLQEIKKWLEGASDAIDKNYLRELYLIFSNEDEPDRILESYKFQFRYYGENEYMENPVTKDQLYESTKALLETIGTLKMQEYECLDVDKTEIKMALTYYQDVTPSDYHPPLFGSEDTDGKSLMDALSSHSTHYYKLGFLKTGFHSFKCRAKGDAFSLEKSFGSAAGTEDGIKLTDEQDMNVDNNQQATIDSDDDDHISITSIESTSNAVFVTESTEGTQNKEQSMPPDITNLSYEFNMDAEPRKIINCLCQISNKIDNIDLIECTECNKFQHSVCNGYLHATDVQGPYVCLLCSDTGLTPTEFQTRKAHGICKLIMAIMHFTGKYPPEVVDKVSDNTKHRVMSTFEKNNVIKKINGCYVPNIKTISSLLNTLFYEKSKPGKFKPEKSKPITINLCEETDDALQSCESAPSVQEPPRKRWRTYKNSVHNKN